MRKVREDFRKDRDAALPAEERLGEKMSIRKDVDVVLKIKPVYVHLIHRYPYMGPCRYGEGIQLEREYDEMMAAENFQNLQELLDKMYGHDSRFKLLKPVYLPQTDEFICREEELEVVREDIHEADVILMEGLMGQHLAVNLAKKFHKPMVAVGCCTSTDVTAGLRAAGFEAYGVYRMEDSKSVMEMLRAKKGMEKTRILCVLKGDVISKGVESDIRDFDRITNKWGITFKYMNSEDFLDEISRLDEEEIREAEQVADGLIGNASGCRMDREYVIRSCKVYVAAKKMLKQYDCNAFTLPCFEICATRRLHEEKYTFCLAHSLLKEDCIPSACESDHNALMAMIVMMNLADIAPHMGNLHPALPHELPEHLKDEKNLIRIYHSVPTRYMHGRKLAPSPYGIGSFTAGNWGATIRYDYNADKGKTVTLVRFNPQGTGILAGRGVIREGFGYESIGCDNGFFAEVADLHQFFNAMCNYGHHYVWGFGDMTGALKQLGEVAGFEVEII